MTLRELHARLGAIIAEHEARGWAERNDQTVILSVRRKTTTGRLKSNHFPIKYAAAGSFSVGDGNQYTQLIAFEEAEVGAKKRVCGVHGTTLKPGEHCSACVPAKPVDWD